MVGQLDMANMSNEYVKWWFFETFLFSDYKNVFVFEFLHLEVDSIIFGAQIFFVLNLLC